MDFGLVNTCIYFFLVDFNPNSLYKYKFAKEIKDIIQIYVRVISSLDNLVKEKCITEEQTDIYCIYF